MLERIQLVFSSEFYIDTDIGEYGPIFKCGTVTSVSLPSYGGNCAAGSSLRRGLDGAFVTKRRKGSINVHRNKSINHSLLN